MIDHTGKSVALSPKDINDYFVVTDASSAYFGATVVYNGTKHVPNSESIDVMHGFNFLKTPNLSLWLQDSQVSSQKYISRLLVRYIQGFLND